MHPCFQLIVLVKPALDRNYFVNGPSCILRLSQKRQVIFSFGIDVSYVSVKSIELFFGRVVDSDRPKELIHFFKLQIILVFDFLV